MARTAFLAALVLALVGLGSGRSISPELPSVTVKQDGGSTQVFTAIRDFEQATPCTRCRGTGKEKIRDVVPKPVKPGDIFRGKEVNEQVVACPKCGATGLSNDDKLRKMGERLCEALAKMKRDDPKAGAALQRAQAVLAAVVTESRVIRAASVFNPDAHRRVNTIPVKTDGSMVLIGKVMDEGPSQDVRPAARRVELETPSGTRTVFVVAPQISNAGKEEIAIVGGKFAGLTTDGDLQAIVLQDGFIVVAGR